MSARISWWTPIITAWSTPGAALLVVMLPDIPLPQAVGAYVAASLAINRLAGLRNFMPDRSPLIGADTAQESFIWCAALGGYGIQTAPAVARLCAALTTRQPIPENLRGIRTEDAAPHRVTSETGPCVLAVAELK